MTFMISDTQAKREKLSHDDISCRIYSRILTKVYEIISLIYETCAMISY